MIYTWKCRKCGGTICVERKLADIDVPPTADELARAGCETEDFDRILSDTSFALRGNCWAKDGYKK